MIFSRKVETIIIMFFLIEIFISCSSSSVNHRYNKPREKETEKVDNSVRFTDDNDKAIAEAYSDEFDEEPVEEKPVDIDRFISENELKSSSTSKLTAREKVLAEIVRYINTPYQYGGGSKSGIDCSAFTQDIFSKSLNFSLPRTASEQYKMGREINSENNLVFGDLVFFNTTKNSYPGHVGIYLGDELFAHSSSSRGVTISSIQNYYFNSRFIGGRRPTSISN